MNHLDVIDGLEAPEEGEPLPQPFALPGFHYPERAADNDEDGMTKGRIRVFEEVRTGNFVCKKGSDRLPSRDENELLPRLASWRSNLVALSQRFNLYFTAYIDKIYIFVPRGLRFTINGNPDLILDLPRTERGVKVGGYINQHRPHCVNHMKVGNLGDFEVLLMACDDGDVLAYYTHLLQHEIEAAAEHADTAPVSQVQPLIHDNVGISAWGLAIHEKSRMIAVGSNFREVTIFLPGYSPWVESCGEYIHVDNGVAFHDTLPSNYIYGSCVTGDSVFVEANVFNSSIRDRRANYKIRYMLGSEGHNIPSVEFASDLSGEAQAIMAADINGNLWIINIWDGVKKRLPRLKPNPAEDADSDEDQDPMVPPDSMGWGVLYLPLSYFKIVRTPHEALGGAELTPLIPISKKGVPQCFDITSTTSLVKGSNPYHPNHPEYARAKFLAEEQNTQNLEEDSDMKRKDSLVLRYDAKRKRLIRKFLARDELVSRWALAAIPKTLMPKPGTDKQKAWIGTRRSLARILERHPDHPLVMRWVEETSTRMERFGNSNKIDRELALFGNWIQKVSCPERYLPPTATTRTSTTSPSTASSPPDDPSIRAAATSIAPQHRVPKPPCLLLPDPTATVLRTWNHDMQLLPSSSTSSSSARSTSSQPQPQQQPQPQVQLLSTICRGLVKQELSDHQFAPFDRLNMLAAIPALSLVVVASQLGRAALITLTKLDCCDEEGGLGMPLKMNMPMPMARIDLVLPLERDEAHRPLAPLLGMAVGEVRGGERGGSGGSESNSEGPWWRIVLHYFDHSVLSYEIGRREDGTGLEVW